MHNPLKRITCKHKWISNGYVSEEFKPGYYRFLSVWECKKCGKTRVGQFRDKESLWLKLRLKKKLKTERKVVKK